MQLERKHCKKCGSEWFTVGNTPCPHCGCDEVSAVPSSHDENGVTSIESKKVSIRKKLANLWQKFADLSYIICGVLWLLSIAFSFFLPENDEPEWLVWLFLSLFCATIIFSLIVLLVNMFEWTKDDWCNKIWKIVAVVLLIVGVCIYNSNNENSSVIKVVRIGPGEIPRIKIVSKTWSDKRKKHDELMKQYEETARRVSQMAKYRDSIQRVEKQRDSISAVPVSRKSTAKPKSRKSRK